MLDFGFPSVWVELSQYQPFKVFPFRKRKSHRMVDRASQALFDHGIDPGIQCGAGDDFLEQVGVHAAGA